MKQTKANLVLAIGCASIIYGVMTNNWIIGLAGYASADISRSLRS